MAGNEKRKRRQLLRKRLTRLFSMAALVVTLLGLTVLAWHWKSTVPLKEVHVGGVHHATVDEIKELARVDSLKTLYAVRPDLVIDRVSRHAWVAKVNVRRLPTGTLRIRITEREPAALVIDPRGRPAWYVDGAGYSMPLVSGAVYDLPLLIGLRSSYNPRQQVENPSLVEFLAAIRDADESVRTLISEVHVGHTGDITVYTVPADARGAVTVRLGRSGYATRLHRLRSFWEQAVLAKTNKKFALIDLRFDNQIVTREEALKN